MIIDSHQHFWDRDLSEFDHSWQDSPEHQPICRTYLPEHLLPLIHQEGVDRTVFVQTQHNLEENRWALKLAEQNPFIAGVVGWIDLASPDCEQQLLQFKDHPKFVGIRHVVQDEPDDQFILRDDVSAGLRVLEEHRFPYDLLFFTKHLRHAPTVADRFPNLPLVIDHLSKPEIKSGNLETWKTELGEAAKRKNVWCKLSGMVTEADWNQWTIDDLRPYVEVAIECFTPDRIMFGSDWPVCELAANYHQVVSGIRTLISGLSESEQSAIMGENAIRFYGLSV